MTVGSAASTATASTSPRRQPGTRRGADATRPGSRPGSVPIGTLSHLDLKKLWEVPVTGQGHRDEKPTVRWPAPAHQSAPATTSPGPIMAARRRFIPGIRPNGLASRARYPVNLLYPVISPCARHVQDAPRSPILVTATMLCDPFPAQLSGADPVPEVSPDRLILASRAVIIFSQEIS